MRLLAYKHNVDHPEFRERVLKELGIKADKIQRERAVFCPSLNRVIIHTRTGGKNRLIYPNNHLIRNQFFLKTVDDSYDTTYADFIFGMPPKLKKWLVEEANNG